MTRRDDRRETGRAQAVQRDARDAVRQSGEKQRHARDVAIVLAGLIRVPEIDVLDLVGRHARAPHRLGDHERGEIVGPHTGERTAVPADRCADA